MLLRTDRNDSKRHTSFTGKDEDAHALFLWKRGCGGMLLMNFGWGGARGSVFLCIVYLVCFWKYIRPGDKGIYICGKDGMVPVFLIDGIYDIPTFLKREGQFPPSRATCRLMKTSRQTSNDFALSIPTRKSLAPHSMPYLPE